MEVNVVTKCSSVWFVQRIIYRKKRKLGKNSRVFSRLLVQLTSLPSHAVLPRCHSTANFPLRFQRLLPRLWKLEGSSPTCQLRTALVGFALVIQSTTGEKSKTRSQGRSCSLRAGPFLVPSLRCFFGELVDRSRPFPTLVSDKTLIGPAPILSYMAGKPS